MVSWKAPTRLTPEDLGWAHFSTRWLVPPFAPNVASRPQALGERPGRTRLTLCELQRTESQSLSNCRVGWRFGSVLSRGLGQDERHDTTQGPRGSRDPRRDLCGRPVCAACLPRFGAIVGALRLEAHRDGQWVDQHGVDEFQYERTQAPRVSPSRGIVHQN